MNQNINLNLVPSGLMPIVHSSQYDVDRTFTITLYDGSASYNIPTGATIFITGIKGDRHVFEYTTTTDPEVISYTGSLVTISTPQQMTAAAGLCICELRIVDPNGLNVGTLNFVLDVEADPVENGIISDTDISAIQEYTNTVVRTADKVFQQRVRVESLTLEAINWTGNDAPFSYDLGSAYDDCAMWIAPAYTATDAQLAEWQTAEIYGSASTVIYARKSKPTVDLPVLLMYWKVVEV